jgi:hypothetical protein
MNGHKSISFSKTQPSLHFILSKISLKNKQNQNTQDVENVVFSSSDQQIQSNRKKKKGRQEDIVLFCRFL